MTRELLAAYSDVLTGERARIITLGSSTVELRRERSGEKDEHKIELPFKERISVYIDGKKQADSAVVLGLFGIMKLINSEPTSPNLE